MHEKKDQSHSLSITEMYIKFTVFLLLFQKKDQSHSLSITEIINSEISERYIKFKYFEDQ